MRSRLLLAIFLVLPALPVCADGVGGAFGGGRTQFSLVAGNSQAFNKSYVVFGGSASYYMVDGLGIGLSAEKWSGDGPDITKYAPFVQYVFYQVPGLQPYIGGFYRQTTIEGLPSIKSTGTRAGVLMKTGSNAFLSVGMVYESYLDCQETVYRVCRESFPDIKVIFSF